MKEGNLSYWPGTIVDVFLRARGTTVLYKVEFWDKTTASVPRRCLFTPEDRQFFTCQVRLFAARISLIAPVMHKIGYEFDLHYLDRSPTSLRQAKN